MGAGGPHVRDGGRVPALLRGPAHTDLREDRLGEGECMQGDMPRDARDPGSGSCCSMVKMVKKNGKTSARCARFELRVSFSFFFVRLICPVMSAIWTWSPQLDQACPPTEVGCWAIMLIAEKRGLCRSVAFDEKGAERRGLHVSLLPPIQFFPQALCT